MRSTSIRKLAPSLERLLCLSAAAVLTGSSGGAPGTTPLSEAAVAAQISVKQDRCSQLIVGEAFKHDPGTKVLLVKPVKKGDPLPNRLMEHMASNSTASMFAADLCLVKLLVSPPNPGPPDAPSTSQGIGIEVWLPQPSKWNGRIHAIGSTGWGGGEETILTAISSHTVSADGRSAPTIAAEEGAVTSTNDTGHRSGVGGSFAMNPDGSINTKGWEDYSHRGVHEQAIKTKVLATAYYGSRPKYSYFDGASGGGRQAIKAAQSHPEDFDGILAGVPGINRTRFWTADLYPQVVIQQDLGGKYLTADQVNLVSNAAIAACDLVGGQHLGFVLDYGRCRYDPVTDMAVLCASDGGHNTTPACVSRAQARAVNKMWYGMTRDGSVPDPAVDNGWDAPAPSGVRLWYGLPRGTNLLSLAGARGPYGSALDLVALELQNPRIAAPNFKNATGNGENAWKRLTYAQLADAYDKGVALQPQFGFVMADDPDLSAFKARGGKLLHYANVNDELIPSQGSSDYYRRVVAKMDGVPAVQTFYRLYMVPGLAHAIYGNGTTNTDANPPLPRKRQLFDHLVAWVEEGKAPEGIVFTSAENGRMQKSLPLCAYPAKPTHVSGSPFNASSYACQ